MTALISPITDLMKSPCIDFMFAYSDHDMDKMTSLCDTDGEVWFKPMGEAGRGTIGELGRGIWSTLIDAFPNLENTVHAAIAEEDGTIRCQVLIQGKQAKDFADVPTKGQQFSSDHIFIFRLDETNLIDRIHIEWNHEDFKKQLGA